MDYDVVVIGEVLLEIGTTSAFRHGVEAGLGCSGDALNSAAAAAAAGARVGLLTRIGDDEVGAGILERVEELGVDTGLVERTPEQNGCYLMRGDPGGTRAFAYMRRGSAASGLSPEHVRRARLDERARCVLTSGITAALSETARDAVLLAAELASDFVYDPNYRPALTGADEAAAVLRAVAPGAGLVTPSDPGESSALLGCDTPEHAAHALRALGAEAVAVTCGERGVLVDSGSRGGPALLPPVPAERVVDQTGAGDVFAGTATARLALGDELDTAVELAAAAASLSLGGRGGTGAVPSIGDTREHLGSTSSGRVSCDD